MSAAWAYASRITDAQAKWGWMARTRGVEGGGKVEGLPVHTFPTDDGGRRDEVPDRDRDHRSPRVRAVEPRLLAAGPLQEPRLRGVHGRSVGAEAEGVHEGPTRPSNAALSAKFNYIMCVSRFAHYLKVMARDKIGSFMETSDCEALAQRMDHELRRRRSFDGPATS